MEPIHAVVLPRGKSLDQCIETLHKRTRSGRAGTPRPPKCQERGGARPPPRSVFDFLNETLQCRAPGALEAGAAPPGRRSGKEMYRAGESAKRALSLRLFQTERKIKQTQQDIQGIQKALARNTGRYVWGQTHTEGRPQGGSACSPAVGIRPPVPTQEPALTGGRRLSEEGLDACRGMGGGYSSWGLRASGPAAHAEWQAPL